jgi:16S rRNA (cytidine1402-2'-O)-methyltransferase
MAMPGKLFVIGTPIGNLKDITLRALEVLNLVDVLVCEDSRVASRVINHYLDLGMITKKPRYVPYNEFNEDRIFPSIVEMVKDGEIVGLVSDAGMPTLSDPGYRLVRAVLDAHLSMEIVPGPTALTTALPWSGIGGEVVLYLGFLPKTSGKALKLLSGAKTLLETLKTGRVVLYVSPHRLLKDLEHIKHVLGEVRCVLLRELTKQHQERIEGTVSELLEKYGKTKVRGELVLVLSH